MKKIFALMLALAMLATCAVAESSVGTLFDAAVKLAYETDNVTLTANATFTWDGELFKTMRASYKQDGYNSFLDYMLDTPKEFGEVYTGGYSVLGLGSTVYANETYWGNYYYTSAQVMSDTILTSNSKIRSMLSLARTLAVTAEGLGVSTVDVNEAGTEYHFTLGDLPSFIDDAAYFLVCDYMYDNYYRSFFNEKADVTGVVAYYEDWNAFIGELYTKLYNEEMTENSDDMRVGVVYTWANQLEAEILSQYTNGYVFIKNDGSSVHFDSESDCMRAAGVISYQYQDFPATFKAYMLTKGQELSDDFINILTYSPNEELWNAYYAAINECDEYYLAIAREQNPDVVYAVIYADGTVAVYDSVPDSNYFSTTQQIMSEMQSAGVTSLDAVVTVDEQQRLIGFTGTAEFEVTDVYGEKHALGISFELGAADYGTTYVNSIFNPADYGWVTYYEYLETLENSGDDSCELDWDEFVNNAPDTIEFLGVTYDTMMDEYR